STLWDSSDLAIGGGLGGNASSAQSAIIIPPAGGGNLYHLIAVPEVGAPGPLQHSLVGVSNTGSASLVSGPINLPGSPKNTAERVAATSHRDCEKYWIATVDLDDPRLLSAILIDGDTPPDPLNTVISGPGPSTGRVYQMKFSPDGRLLAVGNAAVNGSIHIYYFNNATGSFTHRYDIVNVQIVYGLDFSPDSATLYYTEMRAGRLLAHAIGSTSGPDQVLVDRGFSGSYQLGAVQLAPNDRIYVVDYPKGILIEVSDPNHPMSTPLIDPALDASGAIIQFQKVESLGLPTFTRIADHCRLRLVCDVMAEEVNTVLAASAASQANALPTCQSDATQGQFPGVDVCSPLEIGKIRPTVHITWGDSDCDCIESDDTEVMCLSICNPYSNVTLQHVEVIRMSVTDLAGNPVPLLPDGTPSTTLVPLGPTCFDDIPPCSCVTRQFTLRNRGARFGRYRIVLEGICFDVNIHVDTRACFTFAICKD
ncbi:MAG: hypothetical protein RJA98_4021, partial [Pseudomonadota bacterium]